MATSARLPRRRASSGAGPSLPVAAAGALGAAVVVGVVGAVRPELFAALLGAMALAAMGAAAYRWPAPAMRLCALAVALGETKFRQRDPSATLSSAVDGQVVFELGLSALVGVLSVGALLSPRVTVGRTTTTERVLIGYAAVAVASILWSHAPTLTAVRSVQLIAILLFTVTALRALGPTGFLDAVAAAVIAYVLVFSVVAVVVPGANGTETSWHGFDRFAWFSVHPIQCAVYAGVGIVLALAATLYRDGAAAVRYLRLPAWMFVLPLAAVLAATRSRGPLLAVVVAVAAMVARKAARRPAIPAAAALVGIGALAMAMAGLGVSDVVARGAASRNPLLTLLYRGQDLGELTTFSGRLELWRDVAALVLDHPVLGYGYQGSRALLLEQVPWAAYAHNAVAETLLNVGVVGTAPLLLALFGGLFVGARPGRVGAAAVGTAAFLIANSMTSESFAAAPGLETMLLFAGALLAERSRARRAAPRLVPAPSPPGAVVHARLARS